MGIKQWWSRFKSKPFGDVIRHKHKFVVMDTGTLKEKFSFQLSGINLFVALGSGVIVLIVLTIVLIAFTPLREYIPGYTSTEMQEQAYANAGKVDSLEAAMADQEWLVATIQAMLRGESLGAEADFLVADSMSSLHQVARAYRRSKEDSLLRMEVEQEDGRYEVKPATAATGVADIQQPSVAHLFFSPLKGNVLRPYSTAERHFGVDVAAAADKPVKAAYSGTVVFAGFAAQDGYVIALQHPGNVVTIYRNAAALLKKQGDAVRAGEPIAYVGTGTKLEQGPYLHLEVWIGGTAVNPEEYILF